MRITLNLEDFGKLVRGQVVRKDKTEAGFGSSKTDVEICLSDIGFEAMINEVESSFEESQEGDDNKIHVEMLPQWQITWAPCPTAYNPSQCFRVEATNEENARLVAEDHIRDHYGCGFFNISKIEKYVKPTCGRVVTG